MTSLETTGAGIEVPCFSCDAGDEAMIWAGRTNEPPLPGRDIIVRIMHIGAMLTADEAVMLAEVLINMATTNNGETIQ